MDGDHPANVEEGGDPEWNSNNRGVWNIVAVSGGTYKVINAGHAKHGGGALFCGTDKDEYEKDQAMSMDAGVEDNEGKSLWVFTKM